MHIYEENKISEAYKWHSSYNIPHLYPKCSQQTLHSSPVRAGSGMSFVSSKSDSVFCFCHLHIILQMTTELNIDLCDATCNRGRYWTWKGHVSIDSGQIKVAGTQQISRLHHSDPFHFVLHDIWKQRHSWNMPTWQYTPLAWNIILPTWDELDTTISIFCVIDCKIGPNVTGHYGISDHWQFDSLVNSLSMLTS